ncbi:MAG: arylamine N-acetyltransferase [Ruminococcaceae bacterium]|nr:arylamine N-acetyltransferase [Oscillospiraceae bacterium]
MFSFDVEKYLNRIGVSESVADLPINGETLCLLQKAHLYSVPFENFDIIDGVPLDLRTEALYNKIVERERGGIFTELNGLFGDLLRALGFGVNEYLARILYTEEGSPLKQHRVLEVQARDGNYICDVGIGTESPRIALKKEEGLIQSDGFCEYRIENEPFLGWVLWQRKKMSEWKKIYSFTDEIQLSVDFLSPTFYLEKSPGSALNKQLSAIIRTKDGLIVLEDDVFKVHSLNHEIRMFRAENKEDLKSKIKEYFGIDRRLT